MARAHIVGSGPNGLAAAITLAHAGVETHVYESQSQPGGGLRTMELTLPGYHHDFGAAVFPMGVRSPFFRTLPIKELGVEWVHGDALFAHPMDDGTAVVLERDLDAAARELGKDGRPWAAMMRPFVTRWQDLLDDALQPPLRVPKHPLLMAEFGLSGFLPAAEIAKRFRSGRMRALWAGLAAHSATSFASQMSAAPGLMLGVAGHACGWPLARGGAQRITDALLRHLNGLGGRLHISEEVKSAAQFPSDDLVLGDVLPSALARIAPERATAAFARAAQWFVRGPGTFKLDYALSAPVPWIAKETLRAITVHVGGPFEEIAHAEEQVARGLHPDKPYVIVVQPTLFDPTRAPDGKHTLWAYCHVPNGSEADMTDAVESQIERFAPGFRDCVLARSISNCRKLEMMDANLAGGDVGGGAFSVRQFLFRPKASPYRAGPRTYLCSASTPPGGGVHGMCGANAARAALSTLRAGTSAKLQR